MDIQNYKNFLMSVIPSAKPASGGKFINCRCFNCPDSADPSHRHMYIKIPENQSEPSWYYCHLCHCSGIITHKTLIQWNIYNEKIAVELLEHNRKCSRSQKNIKYFDRSVYTISNTYTSDNDNTAIKLDYINKRLGTSFTYQELRDLKVILNLYDVLNSNHITNLTRDKSIVDQLDANFLGFLSIDNAFCNMRRLCDKGLVFESIDKRYINYKIFDKFDTSERFYTIPTRVDLNSPSRIKLHIAEGPFDILSIYKNIRHEEPGFYTSIAGSNYIGQIMYFLETFMLPYVEIHLYPDNDQYGSMKSMERINQTLSIFNMPLYIHRNMYPGEKDFGVSPDHIDEQIIQMR